MLGKTLQPLITESHHYANLEKSNCIKNTEKVLYMFFYGSPYESKRLNQTTAARLARQSALQRSQEWVNQIEEPPNPQPRGPEPPPSVPLRPDLGLLKIPATLPLDWRLDLPKDAPDLHRHLPRLAHAESLRQWTGGQRMYHLLHREIQEELREDKGDCLIDRLYKALLRGPHGLQEGQEQAQRLGDHGVAFRVNL